jgi:hypothetical protein
MKITDLNEFRQKKLVGEGEYFLKKYIELSIEESLPVVIEGLSNEKMSNRMGLLRTYSIRLIGLFIKNNLQNASIEDIAAFVYEDGVEETAKQIRNEFLKRWQIQELIN